MVVKDVAVCIKSASKMAIAHCSNLGEQSSVMCKRRDFFCKCLINFRCRRQ